MKPINLFVAFAPEDVEYREKIGKHLSILKEKGFINEFCISEITPGSDADLSTRTLMNKAQIILLLISADFLASDECRRFEDLAFSMQMRNNAEIVPVLLRPCVYDESYNKLQILPDNKKPISDRKTWGDEDEALTNVTERIKQLVVRLRSDDSNDSFAATTPVAPPLKKSKSKRPLIGLAAAAMLLLLLFVWKPWEGSDTSASTTKATNTTTKPDTPIKPVEVEKVIQIPDLINLDYRVAVSQLQALGITNINKEEGVICGKDPGMVVNQNPKAGSTYQKGSLFNLQVSKQAPLIKAASIGGTGDLHSLRNGGKYSQNAWALKTTNVVFSLQGTKCSTGKVRVTHALGGEQVYSMRAGQRKSNSKFYGAGSISVYFTSDDPKAELKIKIW